MRLFANCVALYLIGIATGGYIAEWGTPRQGTLIGALAIIGITLGIVYNLRKLNSRAASDSVTEK